MEKTKLLTIAVIGLLLLNIGIMGFMWLGRKPPPHPPMGLKGRTPAAEFLIKELQFDEKQIDHYDQMRKAHRQAKDSIMEIFNKKREAFFNGLVSNDTSKIGEIGEIQNQSEMLTFKHFRDVRALCRPEQQAKFDAVFQNVLKMMNPRQMMPPPPR